MQNGDTRNHKKKSTANPCFFLERATSPVARFLFVSGHIAPVERLCYHLPQKRQTGPAL